MLVHGTMDRGAGMIRLARQLSGHQLVRYDRRGYGRSFDATPARSFDDHVDDLAAVVGDEPTYVFGHSYGGVVALALATRGHHALRGVAVYEAPMAWQEWWPAPPSHDADPAATAERFLIGLLGEEIWWRLPASSRADRRREGRVMVEELNWQTTPRYDLAQIDVPVLVGVGSRSGETAQRAAAVARRALGDSAVHSVQGGDHFAPLRLPGLVADLVRKVTGVAAEPT